MSKRQLSKHEFCIGCKAYNDFGPAGNLKPTCQLGYRNELTYGRLPVPLEPCPKPCQLRTFLKVPKK